MKSFQNNTIHQWIVFYFLGAFLFFIFTLFFIFFQKNETRLVYLTQHASDLEYNKDYTNAIKIWKKLYDNNPQASQFLIKILQNYLLQENYHAILKIIDENSIKVYDEDTFLIVLKHGLIASKNLNHDKLTQKYIKQINNILRVNVFWDRKTNKWIYIDEKFTYNKLKQWVDAMYSHLDEQLSIYTIFKDTETPFFYFNGIISFNKLQFLEKEIYEFLPFNPTTRIHPNEMLQFYTLDTLGFLWFTLKKSQFKNNKWLEEFKKIWLVKDVDFCLNFLKEAKFLVPISYQNQNYFPNPEYENIPLELSALIYEKLKSIKNKPELEKLSGVFIYLQSKITLK